MLTLYPPTGTCTGSACSYPSTAVSCPNGCSNGACNGTGWVAMNSGTMNTLYSAWGSSPTSVWVGGVSGTLLHWNGAQWQARASGTTDSLRTLSGTSETSIFARAGWTLRHFDGSNWQDISALVGFTYIDCITAVADRTVMVGTFSGSVGNLRFNLTRVTGAGGSWVATLLGSSAVTEAHCSLSALPGGQVVVASSPALVWNGAALVQAGAAARDVASQVSSIYATSPDHALVGRESYNVEILNAGQWTSLNVGFEPVAIVGTSFTRAFLIGGMDPSSTLGLPSIALWDGAGATTQTLPAGTGVLLGGWAAPTGEVFAVGGDGLILRGP